MLSARVMLPASSLGPRGIALRYLDGEARSSHPMKGIVVFFFFFFFQKIEFNCSSESSRSNEPTDRKGFLFKSIAWISLVSDFLTSRVRHAFAACTTSLPRPPEHRPSFTKLSSINDTAHQKGQASNTQTRRFG